MLDRSPLKIKWNNLGSWTTEKARTLLDFCIECNISIKKNYAKSKEYGGHYYNIIMKINLITFKSIVPFHDIEREIGKFAAYKCVYLGDDATVDTRFRDYKIRR
jgi:hypothetical protein